MRVRDIAARIGVNMALVIGAPKALLAKQLVRGREVLTGSRAKVLAIDRSKTEDNVCRKENPIGKRIFERFVDSVQFVETPPQFGQCTM